MRTLNLVAEAAGEMHSAVQPPAGIALRAVAAAAVATTAPALQPAASAPAAAAAGATVRLLLLVLQTPLLDA